MIEFFKSKVGKNVMEVGRVTSATQISAMAAPQGQELSSTDWKVYAKVVLSYMLIGIGIALACSSIYIAFAFSPMIAATSPITPIAAGVLLLDSTDQKMEIKAPEILQVQSLDDTPPIGIRNISANCWINASLQVLFTVSAFEIAVKNLDIQTHPELAPIKHAYETYKQGGQVDSQEIRVLISKLIKGVNPNPREPEDPIPFLDLFLRKSGYSPWEEYSYSLLKSAEGISVRPLEKTTSIYLDLSLHYDEGNTLTEMVNSYFNNTSDNVISKDTHIKIPKEIPEDFSISTQSGLADGYSTKKKTIVKESMEISIAAEHIGKETKYLCDSFITHLGNTPNDGHYIAYLNRNGQWWEINDSLVKTISTDRANDLLETAYFRHYQRIPSQA